MAASRKIAPWIDHFQLPSPGGGVGGRGTSEVTRNRVNDLISFSECESVFTASHSECVCMYI